MLHVGLDVHKHFSQVAVTDDGGELVDTRKLHHVDKASITGYFSELPTPVTITMESTRNWYWLYELLEEYGEVKLANASKLRPTALPPGMVVPGLRWVQAWVAASVPSLSTMGS